MIPLPRQALLSTALLVGFSAATQAVEPPSAETDRQVEDLLAKMTLAEKVGQLNQLSGSYATGPITPRTAALAEEVRQGRVGSVLNTRGAAETRALQRIAVEETRLGIPLIFAMDVVHGYRTTFPVPLAEAASWDIAAIEDTARIAGREAAAAGLHWTFAPMVDVARDARWGRIMEGAGEDPYLGARVAEARVRGFQGDDLSRTDTVLACAKHFAGYGAVEAGREYNTTTISIRQLREVYLPPFEAAVRAGCATLMSAFNDVDGVPASGSELLLKRILRGEWGFGGLVVSDWNSIGEIVGHGVAADKREAALLAMRASEDMDMESRAYLTTLPGLVADGLVTSEQVDEAVRRVLRLKFRLGLFADPYRYCDEDRQRAAMLTPEHRSAARAMAQKSIVLLKNEGSLLPLAKELERVALVGPLADSAIDMLGGWRAAGEPKDVVTLRADLQARLGSRAKLAYAAGCGVRGACSDQQIAEAVAACEGAEAVILAVGEHWFMSGENASRAHLDLPGRQMDLVQAVHAAGKPMVVVLFGGRPMTIKWIADHVPAIVEAWLPGIEGGHAIADVLFGDVNPSGKLPVSFPIAVGQAPVYYAAKSTGRPRLPGQRRWDVTKYLDIPNEPLYPFGFGLSYSTFSYSEPRVGRAVLRNEPLEISVTVANAGPVAGEEIVQLYVRDLVASVTRPVKELKRFARVALAPGEEKDVRFTLTPADLAFHGLDLKRVIEPGEFVVMVGPNSRDLKSARFRLELSSEVAAGGDGRGSRSAAPVSR
jgi:beta-glucosidase